MDVLESPDYRINKFLLTCVGQWPLGKPLHKNFCRIGYACIWMSMVVPGFLQLIDVWGNLDYVIDCISILGIQFANCIKLSNYIFNGDKLKKVLLCIQKDWNADIYQPQLKILKRYAREGRNLTKIYGACMYSTLGTFIIAPAFPKLMDMVLPLNESRPLVYLIPARYGNINPDEYYIPIMLHADLAATVAITTIVAIDSTYTVYVQHACGIFAALGDRLQHLMEPNKHEIVDEIGAKKEEEATYQAIVECIKIHAEAIDFVNELESSQTFVSLIIIGLSVFLMSVAQFQLVMNLDHPNEAVRFTFFTLAQVVHIFFISLPGQKLIDHSERVHEWAYGAGWYKASTRSQKLLLLMMMRSREPCKLTAGKLCDMSLVNFSVVMKTSMSYFTMLTSFS